jgi:hypothetical protein
MCVFIRSASRLFCFDHHVTTVVQHSRYYECSDVFADRSATLDRLTGVFKARVHVRRTVHESPHDASGPWGSGNASSILCMHVSCLRLACDLLRDAF